MELRGYDDYEVTLGDRIRGERASLGKSISDVERELHIKASLIEGIENADLSAFPNPSVVSGYVRSYGRYLRIDPEEFYRQFCAESGFVPPNLAFGQSVAGGRGGARTGQRIDGSPFDQSRFAVVPGQQRFAARISFGWIASAAALLLLVGGIGYGGYALLQNVQRVGFAPLPEAPEVVTEAPRLLAAESAPGAGAGAGAGAGGPDGLAGAALTGGQGLAPSPPDAGVYGSNGPLAAVFAPDDQPPIQRRDGPISAIDPGEAGVFSATEFAGAPARVIDPRSIGPLPRGMVDSADDAIARAEARMAAEARARAAAGPAPEVLPPEPEERGVFVTAVDRAWIRVRDDSRTVLFEGILEPGKRFELPPRVVGAELRTGNAGGVYLVVDGEPHGPVGGRGKVVGKVALGAEEIRARFGAAPEALAAFASPAPEGEPQQAASLAAE